MEEYNASVSALKEETEELKQELKDVREQLESLRLESHGATTAPSVMFTTTPTVVFPTTPFVFELPCNGTQLRVSGAAVRGNLTNAPDSTVCIGNLASPSPDHNFLVFQKTSALAQLHFMGMIPAFQRLTFLGTQSLLKGFIDFTPYVTWVMDAQNDGSCKSQRQCSNLPAHLRSDFQTNPVSYDGCSRSKPDGFVTLVCPFWGDTVVDNNGAIMVLNTDTETMWY
jgi:hypothetical protein